MRPLQRDADALGVCKRVCEHTTSRAQEGRGRFGDVQPAGRGESKATGGPEAGSPMFASEDAACLTPGSEG